MGKTSAGTVPDVRPGAADMRYLRRLLEMLPDIFQDRVAASSKFSAEVVADDIRKCAVVVDGLRALGVYVAEDISAEVDRFWTSGQINRQLGIAALIEMVAAALTARASRFALPGLEVDWRIARQGMRRAAVAVVDEVVAARFWCSRWENANIGLIGVGRAARAASGGSGWILARKAERADAADPAAALAAGLAQIAEAKARVRRARRRIVEGRRPARARRVRVKGAVPKAASASAPAPAPEVCEEDLVTDE